MKMTGEQQIAAPRAKVWTALNDPEVLKACIPGCQSLEKVADDRMRATAVVKVGPISARFAGDVTLSELDPPNSYRISGEGQGGAAGFAKGGASVRLSDDGPGTLLSYDVDAQVGGKLSQLGGGLIDATAKQMAASFFKRFSEVVAAPAAEAAVPPPSAGAGVPTDAPPVEPARSVPPAAPAPLRRAAPAAPGLPPLGVFAVLAATVGGFLLGRIGAEGEASAAWTGLAVGLLVVMVAAGAFAYGRRTAMPAATLTVDPAVLAGLLEAASRKGPAQ